MKLGIITHYNVHNHGALLQLYALKQVLEEKNNNVKALTFKKNFDFLEEGIDKKYNISLSSIKYYYSFIKKIGIRRAYFNFVKMKVLNKFRNPLIGEYYSRAKNLDGVFIGSDEVFSIEAGINPFFFGIGIPCKKIYSYAACCGPINYNDIENYNMSTMISAGLKQFRKISVRDNNTNETVYNLSGINSEIVCDPVILYGYVNEIKALSRKIKQNYILIYSYDNNMNNKTEVAKIKDYARKNNLIIVSAGFYHKWCDKNINCSPIELLSYFKYAQCIVTDTFHGSVMSLITNAEFVAKLRNNKNKLYDLLNRFETSDRIINNFEELQDKFSKKINYEQVNAQINQYRKKSLEYLNSCLEDCSNE